MAERLDGGEAAIFDLLDDLAALWAGAGRGRLRGQQLPVVVPDAELQEPALGKYYL